MSNAALPGVATMPGATVMPGFADVEAAARRLAGVARLTPVMTSRTLDAHCGRPVFLKCESFQRSGSFKIRGAYNALSAQLSAAREAGVITHSSGNHAQALALAGQLLGVSVLVVMPHTAPRIKIEATRGYGAEVHFYDPQTEEREVVTARLQAEQGRLLIPPFDHPLVIAGQGTCALELLAQIPTPVAVLAPCGGGGLLSGTAIAVKQHHAAARVIGVEPAGADNGTRAFRAGEIVTVPQPQTMADGLKPKAVGPYTFAVIRHLVDDMVTVSEEELRSTLAFLWNRMKLVVEPSGAAALAALFHGKLSLPEGPVGVIISGGNADVSAVAAWMAQPQA
jgi:threonine dehydratase